MADYYNAKGNEFGYGTKQIEPGQIFGMSGLIQDEKLRRHGYVGRASESKAAKGERRTCDACSKSFVDERFYNIHLSGRQHPKSPNYQEGSLTEGEKPTPQVAELLTGNPAGGGVPTY